MKFVSTRSIDWFNQDFINSTVSWLSHCINYSIRNIARVKSLDVGANFIFCSCLKKQQQQEKKYTSKNEKLVVSQKRTQFKYLLRTVYRIKLREG